MASISEIASNTVEAADKKIMLLAAVNSYRSFSPASLAGLSDGQPPHDHDARVAAYTKAASQYAWSLERDADAIERVGIAFEGSDRSMAWGLLGFSR